MKVRFNLGAGKNFMHWSVDGAFYDPNTTSIALYNCRLYNKKRTAQKIFAGAYKEVCAWIECEYIELSHNFISDDVVLYNPRKCPNWNINGRNADNERFDILITIGNKVFTTKQQPKDRRFCER